MFADDFISGRLKPPDAVVDFTVELNAWRFESPLVPWLAPIQINDEVYKLALDISWRRFQKTFPFEESGLILGFGHGPEL